MKLIIKLIRYPFNLIGLQIVRVSTLRSLYQKHRETFNAAKEFYKFSLENRFYELTDSEYLQFLELKYGGYITDVPATISPIDVSRIYAGNHTGGNRMNIFIHNYSEKYSQYLKPLRYSDKTIVIVEIGILKGTGLAIWDEYFDNKVIYGFDYDLGNFEQNKSKLVELGAFQTSMPIIKFFDQFSDNSETLKETFRIEKIDIVIDDAYHSDKSIINTFNELQPYLDEKFIYIIEDNRTAWKKLKIKYPHYNFDYNDDQLTVVTKK